MRGSKFIAKVLVCILVLSIVFSNLTVQTVNAATLEKKEKFIVKHQDNERLKAKFFPVEVAIEEGQTVIGEVEATTDAAIDVVVDETTSVSETDPLTYEAVTDEITTAYGTVTEIQELLNDPDVIAVEYDSLVSIHADIMQNSLVMIGEDQIFLFSR